jgi:predicted signal transduction protein with EAL and GGDEF domain
MNMSMYRQLWLAIIVSTLLSLCGGLLASLLSARGYLESQLSIKNTDNATALALSLSQGNPDAVMADLVVASLFDSGHYELIRIVDPKGEVIAERSASVGDLDAPAWFVSALPLRAHPGVAQVSSGWKQFGTVTLVSHSRFAYGALWKSAYEMVFALSLAGLVGGYLGALVLRRLRGPLNAVISQAEAITQRRFVSIELPSVPELRQLAVAMNATVGRLKSMFEEEAGRLEAVRREANFDPLTGLANRSHFMARLRQSLESEDSVGGSLLLIRLADLVGVNRRLGRGATDEFLRQVGGVVGACAAPSLANVAARLNGADFAVLLGQGAEGRAAADTLLAALIKVATPFVESDAIGWIGVGRFKQGSDMGALLARVDTALAGLEADGANAVREVPMDEDDEMPRTAEQWSVMIKRALEHGWVRLISFPVVDAKGNLSHRECPLRLMFDEKGEWLPAGRFLPVAERLKLTPSLDLAAVALGLKELQAQPKLPGLAINLSASSVGDANFRSALLALLANQKEHTSRLWLEVAEAGALKHLDEFRQLCRGLKSVGCHVGLEHYGHQFSQIGVLHDMGLDYLKVDSSFVRGVDSNAGNVAFLKGLCSIARNIGLQVLAEGVATQAELAVLVSLGFDGATGPAIQEV